LQRISRVQLSKLNHFNQEQLNNWILKGYYNWVLLRMLLQDNIEDYEMHSEMVDSNKFAIYNETGNRLDLKQAMLLGLQEYHNVNDLKKLPPYHYD
jgi:hypothetical protein